MRIAYLLTSFGIGGAERQVAALAERVAARGHEVVLIVLRPAQRHEVVCTAQIIHLGMTGSLRTLLAGLLRARKVLRKFRPDLLHSHTFPANMVARMLRLLGAAPKVMATLHNVYEGGWKRTFAYRITDPLCIHTTAVSQAVAHRYLQIGAVPRNKCSVITNGIDTEVFAPSLNEKLPEGNSDWDAGRFVWLAAGRDVPAKDFASLLAAFRLVCDEEPDARLRIAGESRNRQVGVGEEFEQVRWLGHCGDMAATMESAHAFVLSSAWEGMPLVVGEAMAMEKPVVATAVGGVCELVGDTGALVPPNDPQALAAAMLRVMRMPEEERSQMGRAARARIVRSFGIDAKVCEWQALYRAVLDSRAQSAESNAW